MLIRIINNNSQKKKIDDGTKKELSIHGIDIMDIDASSMSFVTTMRIATACKKATPDLVIADNDKNAIAAIYARELTRKAGQDYPVAMRVKSSDKIPTSIRKEIRTGVDIWLFDLERTRTAWKNITDTAKSFVLGQPLHVLHVEHSPKSQTLVYVGEMNKCERLSEFITALANLEHEKIPTIRVCGTAKARYVMPVVKRTRLMRLDIEWLGDNYEINEEIKNATGFIVSDNPYSTDEIRALAAGVPLVTAENLCDWLDNTQREIMAKNAIKTYGNNHDPKTVANRLKEIINTYRNDKTNRNKS